ncbi:MAG: DUF4097 domain-containing protein [Turicibacter sp.]|nr:DUF4097 domain-containing protein [Turicibacter sp.]
MKRFKIRDLIFLAVILIGIGSVGSWLTRDLHSEQGAPLEKTISDGEFTSVDITANNGRIEFFPSQDGTARIIMNGGTGRRELSADIVDEVLVVNALEGFQFVNVDFRRLDMSLAVYLPVKEYDLLKATTQNGAIAINGFAAADMEFRTSNGRIAASDLAGDRLAFQSSNGRLDISGITGSVSLRTTNGRINLADITGDIEAVSSNGRIEWSNPTIAQNVDLRTTNGRIDVQLSQEPESASINGRTSNSSIEIFGQSTDSWSSGTDYDVTLTTSNSPIRVN